MRISDWSSDVCSSDLPTQKPEALLYRTILAATQPGEVILDPFFGSGTTGAVARRLGRRCIGIERDPDYARIAEERIAGIEPDAEAGLLATTSKRDAPRVPFGSLIERGLLRARDVLSESGRAHV